MRYQTHGRLFINGEWRYGLGEGFSALNPSDGKELWRGKAASDQDIDSAIEAARGSFEPWANMGLSKRMAHIQAYADCLEKEKKALAEVIACDAGKPLWEAETEAGAMIGKIGLSIKAQDQRAGMRVNDLPGGRAYLRHKPHGVIAVFGPYNFPGHLPNGHIVPALLAGNTVVFKPSEQTPLTAEFMVHMWQKAGLPSGVLNLVQGEGDVGRALAAHPGIDGLFFTGSARVGHMLHAQFAHHPDKILALELGGNNPLVVWGASDADAAGLTTVQSAFLTAGQRCTCARRLVVQAGKKGDDVIDSLVAWTNRLRIGPWDETPDPFMGPLISTQAADSVASAVANLVDKGAKVIRALERPYDELSFLSPAILDVTGLDVPDEEIFGPVLQVTRVETFDDALMVANNTRFGLAAGLFSDSYNLWKTFLDRSRAGVVNWNRQMTGASGSAPFGGIGASGNHRPSAYYAADYAAYPVASMESEVLELPTTLPKGIEA